MIEEGEDLFFIFQQAEIVTRLAEVYTKLIEAGDVQYLNWSKEYLCDVDKAKTQGMEQYFKDINFEIERFEDRLRDWESELTSFRMQNPVVNHFTVKQMLVLRKFLKEFASKPKDEKPSNQVLALLKNVSHVVTIEKIKECCLLMHASNTQQKENKMKETVSDKETNFTRFSFKELSILIEKYVAEDEDIDRNVFLASLMEVPDFSKERKVFIWCGKNKDNEDLIEELSEQAEKELEKMKENSLR